MIHISFKTPHSFKGVAFLEEELFLFHISCDLPVAYELNGLAKAFGPSYPVHPFLGFLAWDMSADPGMQTPLGPPAS